MAKIQRIIFDGYHKNETNEYQDIVVAPGESIKITDHDARIVGSTFEWTNENEYEDCYSLAPNQSVSHA